MGDAPRLLRGTRRFAATERHDYFLSTRFGLKLRFGDTRAHAPKTSLDQRVYRLKETHHRSLPRPHKLTEPTQPMSQTA
jgi:hypothetical protein